MTKNKKLLLTLSTVLVMGAPLSIAVACGSTTKASEARSWSIGTKRNLRTYSESPDGNNSYAGQNWRYAPVTTYTAADSLYGAVFNATATSAFTFNLKGTPKFDSNGVLVPGTSNTVQTLAQETVKGVEIVKKDGTIVLFDSDSASTSDPKSVNGDVFKALLKSAEVKSIDLKVNTDIGWTKQGTGEPASGEYLKAEDFWYSMQYTIFSNDTERSRAIGSKADSATYDEYVNKQLDFELFNTPEKDGAGSSWKNSFVESYALESGQFDESNHSKVVKDNETFSYTFADDSTGEKVFRFWDEIFIRDGGIKPLPSTFIKTLATSTSGPTLSSGNKLPASNPVKKYGVFSNRTLNINGGNQGLSNYRTAGRYYVSNNDNKRVVAKRNEHYGVQSWLDRTDTPLTYTIEVAESGPQFIQQAYQAYNDGSSYEAAITKLDDSEQINILKNPEKYGVYYTKGFTSETAIFNSYLDFVAVPFSPAQNPDTNYYFNNNYAKAMWGGTIDELKTGSNQDWYKTYINGHGATLRTALAAAVNWHSLLKETWPDGVQTFLPGYGAPEVAIKASPDASELEKNTPISSEYNDMLQALSVFVSDQSGNLSEVTKVTADDYKDVYNSGTIAPEDKYHAPEAQLKLIKTAVKNALDAAGISVGEKVVFEIPVGRLAYDVDMARALEALRIAINSLDDRLNAVAETTPGKYTEGSNSLGTTVLHEKFNLTTQTLNNGGWFETSSDGVNKAIARIFEANSGVGAQGLSGFGKFSTQTLGAAMTDNSGYLQSGSLLAFSYYFDNPTSTTNVQYLDEVGAVLDQTLKDKILEWTAETSAELGLVSKHAATIKASLISLKFEDIYKSNPHDLSVYDYLGFKGYEDLKDLRDLEGTLTTEIKELKDADPTDAAIAPKEMELSELQKDLSRASSIIQDWFTVNSFKLNDYFDTLTVERVAETFDGWNDLLGRPLNPTSGLIGDRAKPGASLRKEWLQTPRENFKRIFIGEWIIDTD